MSLVRAIRERNVSVEVQRSLKNSIILSTLTHGSDTWTWNKAQQSRVHAVEISYLRETCAMTKCKCKSNESLYERYSMEPCEDGMKCGLMEWVKKNTLSWFGHI